MFTYFLLGLLPMVWLIVMLIWSIAVPDRRIWPPIKSTRSRRIILWLMTSSVFVSGFLLGVFDYNQLQWPSALRIFLGVPLIVVGNAFIIWGIRTIGHKATMGARHELHTDGPYRWSRNPQYMADIAISLGWFLLTASAWVGALTVLIIFALLLAPFAEEPWLEEQYGDAYARYREKVTRFI